MKWRLGGGLAAGLVARAGAKKLRFLDPLAEAARDAGLTELVSEAGDLTDAIRAAGDLTAPAAANATRPALTSSALEAFLAPEAGPPPEYTAYMAACVARARSLMAAFAKGDSTQVVQSLLLTACEAKELESSKTAAGVRKSYGDCASFSQGLSVAREEESTEGGEYSGYPTVCADRYDRRAPEIEDEPAPEAEEAAATGEEEDEEVETGMNDEGAAEEVQEMGGDEESAAEGDEAESAESMEGPPEEADAAVDGTGAESEPQPALARRGSDEALEAGDDEEY